MSLTSDISSERKWLALSLAQQSVWLDAKLSDSSAYQLGGWARISAPVDEAVMVQSVRLLIARHDALRLRIDDELPRQWLDEQAEPPFLSHEFGIEAGNDPDAAFKDYVERAFAAPMPLGDHPLFRIDLLRAGPGLNFVLWRFHHLIADSMSVTITLSHWFEAYEALAGSASAELAPPSSYLGTVTADAAYLESTAYHQNLAYWTARFDPLPAPLMADLHKPNRQEKASSEPQAPPSSFLLEGERYLRFEAAARAAGTTVQRALFALCAVTLGRRYGQTDLVSGIALHRRDLSNRHVLGMMAGVIAVRCDFDPFWTLTECIQAFSEQVDADLRHQRLPVDALTRALGLSGTGRTGLFEIAMSYVPAVFGQRPVTDGLPVTTGAVATREASPISLHILEDAGPRLTISLAVNPQVLDVQEGTTLATLFDRSLDRFLDEPGLCFDDLELITLHESDLVLTAWNRTEASFADGTLDGLFSLQATLTPDATAVIGVDGTPLSYAELERRSTRLARQLIAGGVQPEQVVGVRMVRSTDTIIAMLAILKAGGVYLPLDPAYPADRLEYIAANADAMLVLDSIDLIDGSDEQSMLQLPELVANQDASRLAYVIYTSGTTGLPKGVAVEHRAAVNLAFARRSGHDPLGVGDRVLAAISVGFDVSIGQLLLPLLSGATVVIAGEMKTMDPAEFWHLLEQRQITHVNSVPSFLEAVLPAAPSRGEGLALKRLMLGGEALTGTLVGQILEALPGVEVVNMYGPTETCIDATFHIATRDDVTSATLPIGRPLANYQTYVLNERQEPVGIGVSGELYIGGLGVARGYVNAPELNADRLLRNPFPSSSRDVTARLYKTGDQARWRTDGTLEFLGRGDAQVKIRGFRVEPGEIAAQLLQHPDVTQAVVIPQAQTQSQTVRLIAYFVCRPGIPAPAISVLRAHLAASLPDYMVPSAFVPLTEMPLNRNGKLDLQALPSPELESAAHIPARTATEAIVATLFAEVLGLAQCGVHDNFFELGGHSLLATTLVSRLRREGWIVPLRAIFETPTVELLARRIDTSLPAANGVEIITPQPRPATLPLSLSQERIWFVDRLQGDSSYNIPLALHLRGQLVVEAVDQAIARIVDRHEVLRTRIIVQHGEPVQLIDQQASQSLEYIDLSGRTTETQPAALHEHLAKLSAWRFDLENAGPLRILLITLAPQHHVLAAVVHHVAFDGWSAGNFFAEFATLYQAFARQEPDPLPPLALQYADFALWQRGQDRTADLAFWQEELRDAPAQLELPGAVVSHTPRTSGVLPLHLDQALHARLQRLANEKKTSLFMVLHAAFALLLARLSGQHDIVLGTVTANRSHSEFEPLIGCFVNTLPLRTRFSEGESFAALLDRVKHADLASFAHKELPFEELVAALEVERSLERTPLFQVLFVMQNTPWPATALPGLLLEPIAIEAAVAKFDLTLSLAEVADGLTGTMEFAANRLTLEQVERFGDAFSLLLEAITEDPDREALGIDILTPTERSLVLDQWNHTEATFPVGTLDGLFTHQALLAPSAIAIVDRDGTEFDYATLDERSSRLARQLAAHGVKPGETIGVRMERSAATIIALLAILKAGAVYLPLDPEYPEERLAYMVADADARLILQSLDEWTSRQEAAIPALSGPERLAYIIYTSGTTGVPKGVMVAHAAAVNLAFARRAAHDPLGIGDRVLAAISVGFDVSIGQLLLPLLSGATVVIAGALKSMAPTVFWSFLTERAVTHINAVPSFLQTILESAPPAGTLALKRLMLGGEALSGALVARIAHALPGVAVVNMYGPTEACIDATYHLATALDYPLAVLPIGRPLPNYRAYVLDERMRPVGPGGMGELYLGGAGLAEGYLNAPQVTADRFVHAPFLQELAQRLYRTGDRARWRNDGVLEFLGRLDDQIKIRGFRVEPAEIEARLRLLPGVQDAAVVAQSLESGVRLIAYYTGETPTTDATSTPGPDLLRAALAGTLPDYMIPAAFVRLEHLPLTFNGKLDRKALPAPGQEAFAVRVYEAPVGDLEARTAVLWAELLHLERVGRHDNFFELGGHSLLAVTLMERMAAEGLPGDVRDLFTTPTVAGLAAFAHPSLPRVVIPPNRIPAGAGTITPDMLPLIALDQRQIDRIVSTIPGGAANLQDIYPLATLQAGILFQHQVALEGDPYLTPFLLQMEDRSRLDAFLDALARLVERHDVLRTCIRWEGLDVPAQIVLRHVALHAEEILVAPEDHSGELQDTGAALLARFDPRTYRLDLTHAPLLRVAYARDPRSNAWLLLLLTHHLVLDHTSLAVLMRELRLFMSGMGASLPAPAPYRNFIAQVQQDLSAEEHENFFRGMLGDVTESTAPFGLQEIQGSATAESHLELAPALAVAIRQRARALGITPASLFHLAWALVLGHVADTTDVVFATVLFGRMRSVAGGAEMVGMTINTLPLRLRLDATGLADSVLATHRLLAGLMAHEHAPLAFAQKTSALPASTPLFSSLFNYRYNGEPGADSPWPGVEMIHASERTNYPLAMAVDDTGTGFTLTALAQAGPYADQACRYLDCTLATIVKLLEQSPSTAVESIEVLPEADRPFVLGTNTPEPAPANETLDSLFHLQAQATPHAIALVDVDGTEITYAELEQRSTRLAQNLKAMLGDTVYEPVVGVRMERSSATVVALLAILKADAVYLPLDPAYPPDRLDYIAANANTALIVDSLAALESLPDALLPDLASSLDSTRLAYIIYTSGTTGMPKGVAMEHRAAVNLALARRSGHDPLVVGDRVLAAISVGFDVSIGQLLLPLLSGATVVVAGEIKTMGPNEFWSFLADRRVTHINSVPSFFDSMLTVDPPPGTLHLKRIMLGGEALAGTLVQRIWAVLPDVEIMNMYGPTEACIDATWHTATAADTTSAILPIGRPLRNYQALLLNSRMQPVAPEVIAELYLGGASLARGYVHAEDLTAERFVPNPFSNDPKARLYRTGDLARLRHDGAIEFLGRRDGQVKIRGFRVELGEIEVRLRQQPGVRDAAIVAVQSTPSEGHAGTRLIAYYTATDTIAAESLRTALAAVLPDYMVPAAFMRLDTLPLTINGKLDRKALPDPDVASLAARLYEAPIGPAEAIIADIWTALLKVEQVGRQDNFFELGGHSLLAVTLIERMRQQALPCDVRALFNTPTVAGLAASLATASAQSTAPPNLIAPGETHITPEMLPLVNITQTLTQAQLDRILARVPGGAANVQDVYPLSPLQHGILLQHLMTSQGDPYLSRMLIAFEQRSVLDQFLGALGQLLERHDILRTAMYWEGLREPVQVVLRHATLPVEEIELDPTSDLEATCQILARFSPRTFRLDLTQAPLLRTAITWDPASNRWLLLLLTHHLTLDHTSLEILVHELGILVASPGVVLPTPLPYRNFIAQTLEAPLGESHEAFFRTMLADVGEPTAPYGLLDMQPESASLEGRLTLDPALSAEIRHQARTLGITPASLFHLAWAAVLGHVSGSEDVVFGTVLFGRMRSAEGADRVVGMFINTLPLRISIDTAGVQQSLMQVHRLLADLMAHEHAPLALAQRQSSVPPPAPLFSSLFNYRYNTPGDPQSDSTSGSRMLPGIEVLRATESTNYPLAMAVEDSSTQFDLIALTDASIDANRLCAYFEQTLRDLVVRLAQQPASPVCDLQILPPAERGLILEAGNPPAFDFDDSTLDALFIAQARRTPHAIAVIDLHGEATTYAELDLHSTSLARQLHRQGIEQGSVVGVRLERSTQTIVAMIAIFKAGGVYLPLDPAYPAERLDHMASDAGATLILDKVPTTFSEDVPLPPRASDPARLAYVIYTSGTTGLPKGVAVSHRAAVNLAFARRAAHDPLGPGDRVLAATSVGFDVSIGQLLLPLLAGATVVIAAEVKTAGAPAFWTMLVERQVTHINSVPSFFASILDDAPASDHLALKRLMLGGEALTGRLIARLRTALPAVEIVNMYGPTEACIDATFHIAGDTDLARAVLPIGKPLPNYSAYVLDRDQRLAGFNVPGELYLSGAGLAAGYLNAPELTAERFVTVPSLLDPSHPGSRLYRTGDRALLREDGAFEFLGRTDQQIKIRGFRVEPEEIAALLRQQHGVTEASVIARTVDGSTRLIAYLTGTQTQGPAELRAILAATLPDYMVPAAYVWVDRMPLSLNGKLDLKALPAPAADAYALNAYEAPANPTEATLATLWADALKLPHIGRHDHFFALGGDSLSAMRLVTAINKAFGGDLPLDLPVRTLFQHPTLSALATAIATGIANPSASIDDLSKNLVPIQPQGHNAPLFVIHGLSGHVFHYMPLIRALGPEQPVYGLQATGLEDADTPQGTIDEMATRYVDAIQAAALPGPYQLLGYSAGGLLALAMAQVFAERGEVVTFLGLLDTSLPDPTADRAIRDEDLLLDVAGSLGLLDLAQSITPTPTLAELVKLALEQKRLPEGFATQHVERMAAVSRHMIRVCPDYELKPWHGPMLFLSARRDTDASPDWSPLVEGSFRQVDLDCHHLEILSQSMIEKVAETIASELSDSATSQSPLDRIAVEQL